MLLPARSLGSLVAALSSLVFFLATVPFAAGFEPGEAEGLLLKAGIEPTEAGVKKFLESLLVADDGAQIDRLIAELANDDFDVRERATERLSGLAAPPVEKLEAAAKSQDIEQALRAKRVLAKVRSQEGSPVLWALLLVQEKKLNVGLPLLLKVRTKLAAPQVKEAAVAAMLATVQDADRKSMEELLKHAEMDTRNVGGRLLARLEGPEVVPLLEGTFDAAFVKPGQVHGGGRGLIHGWEFRPKSNIVVTHLGVFDTGSDGLKSPHDVAIWDVEKSKESLTEATIPARDKAPLAGVFRFMPARRIQLEAGRRYAIVALYPDESDTTLSMINPSGLTIQYAEHFDVLGRRYTFPHKSMAFPGQLTEGEQHATLGPTFRYEVTPEKK